MKRFILTTLCLLAATSSSEAQRISPQGGTVSSVTASGTGGIVVTGSNARPVVGMRTDCSANDGLKWNGASWVCTSGPSITGSGTAGRSVRWATASSQGNGAFTDDGTNAVAQGTLQSLGNFTAGDSGSADSHTINGATTLNASPATTSNAFQINYGPVAQTNSGVAALRLINNGTYNATSTGVVTYGIRATATGTRSAGSNSVTNTAGLFSASGAQVNRALQTDDGDVLLNNVSGNTTINGNTSIGDADNDNHTIKGRGMWTTAGFANGIQNTLTGGAAAFDQFAIRGNAQGTVDTAAASRTSYGIYGNSTATEASATANLAINAGVAGNASGGEANLSFLGLAGDARFGTANGALSVGYSATATLPALLNAIRTTNGGTAADITYTTSAATNTTTGLNILSSGTYDTTSSPMARGLTVVVNATRSTGVPDLTTRAAYFSADAGQVPLAVVTGSGGNYLNSNAGSTGVGYAAGATLPSKLSVFGTLDATGAITENGARVFSIAGAGLTSSAATVKLRSDCADGQVLKSGSTGTTWTCASDAAGLTGTVTTNTLAKGSSGALADSLLTDNATTLAYNTNKFTVAAASGNTAIAGTLDVTGTTTLALTKVGNMGPYFTTDQTLNFGYGTNAAADGYINYYGFSGGLTQFRNLIIADGKSAPIVTVTGSTKATALAGALSVTGATTLSNTLDVTNTTTLSGTLAANGDSTLGASSSNTLTIKSKINSNVYYAGTAPTPSSCGTSPAVTGNNERGSVRTGTGTTTSCTITFAGGGYSTNAPICMLTPRSSLSTQLYISAKSTTAFTFTTAGGNNIAGMDFDYHCDGQL